MIDIQDKDWSQKYRPTTLKDCLLPAATKKILKSFLRKDQIPSMLFSGTPGIGKTSTAKALLTDSKNEFITINGSLKGNIDTLRGEIHQFASTISLNGRKKYVIIDEADYLSAATQAGLRGFIEEYSTNCGFIFTCNYRNKIIDAIADSRLMTEITFIFSATEKAELAVGVYNRLEHILTAENITYDKKKLQQFIVSELKTSNDLRKLITNAQRNSATGEFEISSHLDGFGSRFTLLQEALKKRDFGLMRKWVGENSDIEPNIVFRHIYDNTKQICEPTTIPNAVVIINEHQYKHAFVADPEINLVACLAEIMADCIR